MTDYKVKIPKRYAKRYATYADAQADGWRRVASTDRDVSSDGGACCAFGYKYESPEGELSTTISLYGEKNKLGREGAFAEMFRK